MDVRQLLAATTRWGWVNSTWTSFSAWANVAGETTGPTAGAVLKAGGAPGGKSLVDCACALAPSKPTDVCCKNFLRDFFIFGFNQHCTSTGHVLRTDMLWQGHQGQN
jgi:hypothetical protein